MESMPDDLEITSIGRLYRGPWDKKYWSCSRGKDRYPYPIGYHAVRSNAGSKYRMEIHEGFKGPVFVVTSINGDSCTGQTPDIAWHNFQKKSGPSVKNWPGKRLSCKVDGVELFGFRNPFVQRLLRELVANVNGIAERSLPSSTFCNGVWQSDSEMQTSNANPDLLPYLRKLPSTGNRTKKNKNCNRTLCKEVMIKRIRYDNLPNDAEGGASEQAGRHRLHTKTNSTDHIHEESMSLSIDESFEIQVDRHPLNPSLKDCLSSINNEMPHRAQTAHQDVGKSITLTTSVSNFIGNEDQGFSSMQVDISTIHEENCLPLLTRGELLEPENSDYVNPREKIAGGFNITYAEGILCHTDKGQPDRLSVAVPEQGHPFFEPKDNIGEVSAMAGYSDDIVPDTCDTVRDDAGYALENTKRSPCNTKHELYVAEPPMRASTFSTPKVVHGSMSTEFIVKSKSCPSDSMFPIPTEACTPLDALSKGLIKDSLPDSSSGSPNPCSERIDLDLAGQELAKSMMTFLLPRAVPLLKKTYMRRRSRHRSRGVRNDPCAKLAGANLADVNAKNDHLLVYTLQGKPIAGILDKQSEVEVHKKITEPGVGSVCKITQVQPAVGNCAINETNSANDRKSIVQDSFEDDKHLCNIALNTHMPDAALGEEIKHQNNTSKSDVNHIGGRKESSSFPFPNDGHSHAFKQLEEFKNVESVSSDSFTAQKHANEMTLFNEKSYDDCVHDDDKTSSHNHGDIMPLHPSRVMHASSLHPISDCKYNTEEMLMFEGMLFGNPIGSHQAEPNEGNLPTSNSSRNYDDNEVLKGTQSHSHSKNGSPYKTLQSSNSHGPVDFDVHIVNSRVPQIPPIGHDGKAVITGKDNSTADHSSDRFKAELSLFSAIHDIPPLESRVLSDLNVNSHSKTCITPKISYTAESDRATDKCTDALISMPVGNDLNINKKLNLLEEVENVTMSESTVFTVAPCTNEDSNVVNNITGDATTSKCSDPSLSCLKKKGNGVSAKVPSPIEWRKNFPDASADSVSKVLSFSENNLPFDQSINSTCKNLSSNQNHLEGSLFKEANTSKEAGGTLELAGCYLHPHPVLSIFVSSKEGFLQISVLCGILNSKDRNLFMYAIPIKEQRGKCPSFLGYTPLVLPLLEGPFDGNMSSESSRLQFTPDEQSLVFLNNIRAPHCREQNISCLCSICKTDYREEYAVEVSYVKFGYVSLVAKLITIERISCILVCDPYLIAAEESGRLHVWKKNKTWRMILEDYLLPCLDLVLPAILDLKRLPKCSSLIIGHNGIGGFGVWDISQRVLLASFSSPGDTIFQIVPISLFSWQDKAILANYQEHTDSSKHTTNSWLSKADGNSTSTPSREDLAVWLLVCAASDSETRHNKVEKSNMCHVGWWRLAILSKNTMVLGSMLDPRASAVDALADYGVTGTCDGLLYKWDLSTGEKLTNLHSLNGGVSRITIDAKSGAVVVADDKCQLLVYVKK